MDSHEIVERDYLLVETKAEETYAAMNKEDGHWHNAGVEAVAGELAESIIMAIQQMVDDKMLDPLDAPIACRDLIDTNLRMFFYTAYKIGKSAEEIMQCSCRNTYPSDDKD